MNKGNLLISTLLLGLILIFAKKTEAVVSPNINIRETENIRVITTVTPTPTLSVTIKPINRAVIRVALKKTNAIKEIDRRLESLKKLSGKINEMKRLSSSEKATLIKQIDDEIEKLENLKSKIEKETDATALAEEKKSITESYRIYALFIPKIEIMAHADKIIEIADTMSGKTTDSALETKIADARAKAEEALRIVTPLLPEQYPEYKTTFNTARDLLREARVGLNSVFSVLKANNPTPVKPD